jgi:hypothetical protein
MVDYGRQMENVPLSRGRREKRREEKRSGEEIVLFLSQFFLDPYLGDETLLDRRIFRYIYKREDRGEE